MSVPVAIEGIGLGKGFATSWRRQPIRAINAIDLQVRSGERVALVGSNGSGKSTLLRLLLGLIQPTEGRIRWWGQTLSPAVRARIGFLPQGGASAPDLTGREALRLHAGLAGRPSGREPLETWLSRLGLADAAGRRVRDYSPGMRQRLGLALALVHGPEALLLDEPTAGVDAAGRAQMDDVLREWLAGGGTLLVASHQPEEITAWCDRVVVMQQGQVAADWDVARWRQATRAHHCVTDRLSSADQRELARWLHERGRRLHHVERVGVLPESEAAMPTTSA